MYLLHPFIFTLHVFIFKVHILQIPYNWVLIFIYYDNIYLLLSVFPKFIWTIINMGGFRSTVLPVVLCLSHLLYVPLFLLSSFFWANWFFFLNIPFQLIYRLLSYNTLHYYLSDWCSDENMHP